MRTILIGALAIALLGGGGVGLVWWATRAEDVAAAPAQLA